jgi:hypothetical protein
VRLDKAAERRCDTVIPKSNYDRDALTLRMDVPRDETAVEFLLRVLPLVFADN